MLLCFRFVLGLFCCWIEEACLLKQERSTCPYYWYEQPYLEYLLSNHPELLNLAAAATPDATAEEVESVAEEVNGDLKLQMCQLKLELYEMKGKLGEVLQEIKEAKQEIKEEIAKENKAAPVFSCHIS